MKRKAFSVAVVDTVHIAKTLPYPTLKDINDYPKYEQKRIELENIRLKALYHLGYQTLTALSLMNQHMECKNEPFGYMKLPKRLFEWDLEGFMERRQGNMLWYQVLVQQLSANCIEKRKLTVDHQMIMKYVWKLFQTTTINGSIKVLQNELDSCYECLYVANIIRENYNVRKEALLERYMHILGYHHRYPLWVPTISAHRAAQSSQMYIAPIEERFILKLLADAEEQFVEKLHKEEDDIIIELRKYLRITEEDNIVSAQKITVYKNEIENLKNLIAQWTDIYEHHLIEYTEKNNYLYKELQYLKGKQATLNAQMITYKERLEEVYAQRREMEATLLQTRKSMRSIRHRPRTPLNKKGKKR